MRRSRWIWQGSIVAALGAALLDGCVNSPGPRRVAVSPLLGGEAEPAHLSARQVADVQVALGRALEARGESDRATAAYLEAVKQDPGRADACARLGVLCDRQAKFTDSQEWYRKALNLRAGDPDLYCNMGYSLYLQRRWDEAAMNLRQALALQPGHRRAHNDLGLVLAHTGKQREALEEFHQGGCDEADAHVNVAFALTLERHWSDAQAHYQCALAADPSSAAATRGLRELNALVARASAGREHPAGMTPAPSPPAAGEVASWPAEPAAGQVAYRPDQPPLEYWPAQPPPGQSQSSTPPGQPPAHGNPER
jgi:tetratricopeptide (TPR) repeat protein